MIELRVVGAEQLVKALGKVRDHYAAGFDSALHRFVTEIVEVAQQRAPVDSGALRQSAYVERPRHEGRATVFVRGGFASEHAAPVESTTGFFNGAIATLVPQAVGKISAWASRPAPLTLKFPTRASSGTSRRGRARKQLRRR